MGCFSNYFFISFEVLIVSVFKSYEIFYLFREMLVRLGNLESKECRYVYLDFVLENCKFLIIVGEIFFCFWLKCKIVIEFYFVGKFCLIFRLILWRVIRNLLSLKLKKLFFDIWIKVNGVERLGMLEN